MHQTAAELQNDVETWKKEHLDAMEYWNVQAVVRERLELLSKVRSFDEKWTRRIEEGLEKFDASFLRVLYGFYNDWYICSHEINDRIAAVEIKGRAVLGAKEHRAAQEMIQSIITEPFEELAESLAGLEGSKARPLQEVVDELRHVNRTESDGPTCPADTAA